MGLACEVVENEINGLPEGTASKVALLSPSFILQINSACVSCQKICCLRKHVLDEEDNPQHFQQKDKDMS